jgi:hypothetical protein
LFRHPRFHNLTRRLDFAQGQALERMDLDWPLEEDWFHLLVSPSPPQQRTLSIGGARVLAGQLRDAVARRHALALARVGQSGACPFDLHALIPIPDALLRRGPDDPSALAWLWGNWGTTQSLRHVAVDSAGQDERRQGVSSGGERTVSVTFWSADWTPWRALAQLRRFCQVSRRAIRRWLAALESCLSGLHDRERDLSAFGEAGATEGG